MVNALSGITGLSSAEVRRNSDSSTILIKLAIEIIRVVNALGVEMKQVNGITTKVWLESENNTEIRNDLKNTLVNTVQKTFGEGRPSLSQDIIKGRKIEIDSLNGYVVRQAKKTGLPVPLNEAIIKVSKLVEAGDLEPSLLNLEYLEI
jgi:2-dehydropantoate 2-reductase